MAKAKQLKKNGPGPLIYLLIAALLVSGIYTIWNPSVETVNETVGLSTFVNEVQSGDVSEIHVKEARIDYTLLDGTKKNTRKESGQTVYEVLNNVTPETLNEVQIDVIDVSGREIWMNILFAVIPFVLIIAFFMFMMKGASNSSNQALSFGKSNAKLYDAEKEKTTFNDVAGAEEAKSELEEIVDFLKRPTRYTAMGAKIPRGVMLVGAPGTGKTLLARAVAGEAKVPFFSISGSEFVEMFVGVGASRVRDLFKKAKRNAPCIVFIDEIDAVGRQRGAGLGGGHDEREQTLNQILTEMDGFEVNESVIVMAATNRPDVLDPALLRPGRFDRRVVVDKPSMKDREAILKVHSRNKPLKKETNLEDIAKQTPGFTGADLENLMNEAAILATKHDRKEVEQHDIESSIEKVQLGPERKSHILSEEEKKITAYHETGHAIVGHLLADCDPVRKITIISRGMSLGSTWFVPEEDKHMYSKQKFEHEIASLLGGYVAEEMTFGQVTTGPSNDLERASSIARRMVTEFGMSEKIGPVVYGEKSHEVFLGRDYGHTKNYSEDRAAEIDEEVNGIVQGSYKLAKDLLKKHKEQLESVAKTLIEKETLSREEFISVFEGKKLKTKAA